MMRSPREKDFQGELDNNIKFPKITSSSRQWLSSRKNPRIVRVSPTFRGKDRHSKVWTNRGLRDTRIRLSVPSAIQLFNLQDKLGLSQPSKVIDWLLDATKHEIDTLPPLPIINSSSFHQPTLLADEENVENEQVYGEGFVAQLSEDNFFSLGDQFSVPNMPYNSNYFHLDPPNLALSQFGGGYSFSTSDILSTGVPSIPLFDFSGIS